MSHRRFTRGEAWMNRTERRHFQQLVQELNEQLRVHKRRHGFDFTLRIYDLGVLHIHVRRAESLLSAQTSDDGEGPILLERLEKAGRIRDRFRKALSEFHALAQTLPSTPSTPATPAQSRSTATPAPRLSGLSAMIDVPVDHPQPAPEASNATTYRDP